MAHSFSTPYSPTEPYSSRTVLSPEPPSPSTTPSSSSSSTSLVATTSGSQSRASPSLLAPSPLRHQTNSSEHLPPLSLSDGPEPSHPPTSPTSPTSLTSSSSATTGKRGVRFAEDDKEDTIPIGYVLRIKKQKEQKARFLREERERRQFEEERRREEAERKQRDEERRQWELERNAWQREKKAMEEQRKSRLFAEEFTASRQRAESQRRGMKVSTSSTSLRESPERNTAQDSKLRLPFDASRRRGSDGTSSPHTPSPVSSRPPSTLGHPGQNTLQLPRPASFHSSHTASSEDVRLSTISTASAPARPRGTTVSARSASQSSLLIPPVPPLPNMFPVDMPLLPPTAPFMMNAFPRARSYNSSPSSRHSNSSSERVNIQGSEHSRSGSSPHRSNMSYSPSSSPHRPTHNRRTSDDSNHRRRSQAPSSQGPSSSYFQQSLPRGRPMYPVYNMPSPWTALPTQTGAIPTTMPYFTSTPGRVAPARRQTTFS